MRPSVSPSASTPRDVSGLRSWKYNTATRRISIAPTPSVDPPPAVPRDPNTSQATVSNASTPRPVPMVAGLRHQVARERRRAAVTRETCPVLAAVSAWANSLDV